MRKNYENYWENSCYNYLLSLGPDKLFRNIVMNLSRRSHSNDSCLVLGISLESKIISIYSGRIIGINTSKKALKRAQLASRKPIDLVLCDAEMCPFREFQFNVIFCKSTLHHLTLSKAIPETHRVLKNEGTLILYEPGLINPIAMVGRLLFPSSIHVNTERPFIWSNLINHLERFDVYLQEQFIILSIILPILGKHVIFLRNRVLLNTIYKLDNLACKTKLKELSLIGIVCAKKKLCNTY